MVTRDAVRRRNLRRHSAQARDYSGTRASNALPGQLTRTNLRLRGGGKQEGEKGRYGDCSEPGIGACIDFSERSAQAATLKSPFPSSRLPVNLFPMREELQPREQQPLPLPAQP